MPKETEPEKTELLQGTLDMLILRTLLFGPMHGHGIAHAIQRNSDDVLLVDHGSLYPALHRLVRRRWVTAAWGMSENHRKAKYYRLTETGRRQLEAKRSKWRRLSGAIARVLQPAEEQA